MHIDLTDKVALVTGGSRGLGREMVLAFARCGADVAIASRKLDACVALAEEVRAETGRPAFPVACHVGRWSDLDELDAAVHAEFGRVDILVNNAGIAPLYPSLVEVGEDLFDKVIAVNLKGPFRLTALIGERMRAGGGGSVINVSSLGARFPQAKDVPYAAAKAGLDTLTVGFALALGPSVRVNTMAPGPFLTDISKAWDVDWFERYAKERYPLQRLGRPSEIVGAALYLASDLSSSSPARSSPSTAASASRRRSPPRSPDPSARPHPSVGRTPGVRAHADARRHAPTERRRRASAGDVAERHVAVDAGLARQAEHALADDVALDLVGPAGDAVAGRAEQVLVPARTCPTRRCRRVMRAPSRRADTSPAAVIHWVHSSLPVDASGPGVPPRRACAAAAWPMNGADAVERRRAGPGPRR